MFGKRGHRVARLEDVDARVGVGGVQALRVARIAEGDDAADAGVRVVGDADVAQHAQVPRAQEAYVAVGQADGDHVHAEALGGVGEAQRLHGDSLRAAVALTHLLVGGGGVAVELAGVHGADEVAVAGVEVQLVGGDEAGDEGELVGGLADAHLADRFVEAAARLHRVEVGELVGVPHDEHAVLARRDHRAVVETHRDVAHLVTVAEQVTVERLALPKSTNKMTKLQITNCQKSLGFGRQNRSKRNR